MVESRWAITMAVRSVSAAASASCTATSDSESRWAVASSRITTLRLRQEQPGDGEALALATGEPIAALAHDGVEAVGQRTDQLVQASAAQGRPQVVVGGARRGVLEVGADRVVEQVAVLGDDADRRADVVEGQVAHVDARQGDDAGIGVVQARHERGDGRLAGSRRAHEGHGLSGLHPEGDAVEHLLAATVVEHGDLLERRQRHLVGGRVAEADVVQLHRHRAGRQRRGIGRTP